MAARGASIFEVMMTFNTLLSLCYGPPALLGLAFRRSPWWSGIATFSTALLLGIVGVFFYNWSLIQQVFIIVPASVAVFFFSFLFDRGDWPERAELFHRLQTPIEPIEIAENPDFSRPVFRFLSRTVAGIGLASLLLMIPVAPGERSTILAFSCITLTVAVALHLVHGRERKPRLQSELESA